MSRVAKILFSFGMLAFAGGIFYSHFTGSLWPGIPVGTASAITFAYLGHLRIQRPIAAVVSFIALGAIYRLYSYFSIGSMIRNDPDAHAVRSQVIMLDGGTEGIVGGFYQTAAYLSIYGAETALITDLPIDDAHSVYPFLVSIVAPLFAAVMVRRVTHYPSATIAAAAITAAGASLTVFSVGPIPMMFGSLFVVAFVIYLFTVHKSLSSWDILTLSLLALGATLSHKVALVLLLGISVAFAVYSTIVSIETGDEYPTLRRTWIGVVLPLTLLAAVQWVYLTTFVEDALLLLLGIFESVGMASDEFLPTSAQSATPGIGIRLLHVSHYLTIVAFGALAGLWLFRHRFDQNIRLLQAAALVTVGFSVPGIVVNAAPGFQRVFIYGIIFAAALLGVGYTLLSRAKVPGTRYVAVGVIVLILIANPLSALATTDYIGTPRQHLNEDEASAKQFAHSYIEDPLEVPVYQDVFFAQKTVNFERDAQDATWHQATVPQPQWHPGMLSHEILNGDLLEYEYRYIAIRKAVDIYQLQGGDWRLTWDPDSALATECHRVHNNPGVNTYDCATG